MRARARAILSLMVGVASGRGAAAEERYDHGKHAAQVQAKGQPPIGCNACHKLSKSEQWEQRQPVGKAGGVHTPCSNAGCHAKEFVRFKDARALCMSCHVGKLGKALLFPPYRERGRGDFDMPRFGHAEHNRADKKTCPQCHTLLVSAEPGSSKEMKRVSHDRCGSTICHGESTPPLMAECGGCHQAKSGAGQALSSREVDPYRVDQQFMHRGHRLRSPKDACGDCHVNIAVEKGVRVPLPPMIACEKCHDGKSAFAALSTQCRRCHGPKEPR